MFTVQQSGLRYGGAALLSILLLLILKPLLFLVYPALLPPIKYVLSLLDPRVGALRLPPLDKILFYAYRLNTPVHWALPIAFALMTVFFCEVARKEKLTDVDSPLFPLGATLFLFLSYIVGVFAFEFFTFSLSLAYITLHYFLYVPVWTAIPGILAGWIAEKVIR